MPSLQIQSFLQSVETTSPELHTCIITLRNIILSYPGTTEEFKYWGIILNKWTEWLNGIFFYKTYISLEFGKWYLLDDADTLEWSGKFRRHIKIYKPEDITTKDVEKYIDEMYGKL